MLRVTGRFAVMLLACVVILLGSPILLAAGYLSKFVLWLLEFAEPMVTIPRLIDPTDEPAGFEGMDERL